MKKKHSIVTELNNIPQANDRKVNLLQTLETLQAEKENENPKIKISFQFFRKDIEIFNLGSVDAGWFASLMESLTLLSNITKVQLFGEYRKKFLPHPYDNIANLNYVDEFLTNPQYECWQLRISKSDGRIHGFFIDNIFYIRFLDKEHNMYNDKRYGGITYVDFPETPYDIVMHAKQEVEEKYLILEEKHKSNINFILENCCDCDKNICDKFKT